MIVTNVRMALGSIRSARTRSFLTMLGVIIGVTSVVTVVSIGEGVKNQVINQINQLGNNIVTVRPGKSDETTAKFGGITINRPVTTSTLTLSDVDAISNIDGIEAASPNVIISGSVTSADQPNYDGGIIIATTDNTFTVLNQNVEFGQLFEENDSTKNVAVLGSNVASSLYNQRDPIGRTIFIKGKQFVIRGILSTVPANPLNIGHDFNDVVYIPYKAGELLVGDGLQISEINARVADGGYNTAAISDEIRDAVYQNHNNRNDFNIVEQTQYVDMANQLFTLLTALVAAIAAISLIVGGIGIMNIMLVSVSERTREIGVRKAIGATNQQILSQFLVEATIISIVGGIVGVCISLIAGFVIRLTTAIEPSISLKTILIALGVATIVGVVFGMAPAIQAARKDPIDALRHN